MTDPVAFTIRLGSITKDIYWYGIIIACALLVGILVAMYHAKLRGYKADDMLDFAIIAVVFAVIGARAHYVIWSWEFYEGEPFWKVFAIWEGGLAIYGGLIGGLVGVYVFSRWKDMRFFAVTDLVIPSLILGQAIGRWGNFVNQEAYGYAIQNAKFMYFPFAVFIQETGQYHLATFFYESLWNFLGFLFMAMYIRKPRREGNIFFLYLLIYGLGRVFIEGLRMDSQMFLDTGIRVNQVISAIIIIIGAAALLFRKSGRIADVYPVKLFASAKADEGEAAVEPVNDDLKLMSDEMRAERKRRLELTVQQKAAATVDVENIRVQQESAQEEEPALDEHDDNTASESSQDHEND